MLASKIIKLRNKLIEDNSTYNIKIRFSNYVHFYKFIISEIKNGNICQNDKNILINIETILLHTNKPVNIADYSTWYKITNVDDLRIIDNMTQTGKDYVNSIVDSIIDSGYPNEFYNFMYKFIIVYNETIKSTFGIMTEFYRNIFINKFNEILSKLMDEYTFNNNKLIYNNTISLSFEFYKDIFDKNDSSKLLAFRTITNDIYYKIIDILEKRRTQELVKLEEEIKSTQLQIEKDKLETDQLKQKRIEIEKNISTLPQITSSQSTKQIRQSSSDEETDLDSLSSVSSESDQSDTDTSYPKETNTKKKVIKNPLIESINTQMKLHIRSIKEKYKTIIKNTKTEKKIEQLEIKMNDEIAHVREKYKVMRKDVRKNSTKNTNSKSQKTSNTSTSHRKSLPKALRNKVWDHYIGREKGIDKCCCCDNEIDGRHFECGHIIAVAKGGEDVLTNLRPICSLCNRSMGVMDMREFCARYMNKCI